MILDLKLQLATIFIENLRFIEFTLLLIQYRHCSKFERSGDEFNKLKCNKVFFILMVLINFYFVMFNIKKIYCFLKKINLIINKFLLDNF